MKLNFRVSLLFVLSVFSIARESGAVLPDLCDGHNLFMFFKDRKDWVSARDDCILRGGRLALINSAETHDAIKTHIRNIDELWNAAGGGYWFGLNDRDNEGTYVFEGSAGVELTYHDGWCSEKVGRRIVNQPNNNTAKNPDGQDCAQLWRNNKKKPKYDFDDAYCDNRKGYICEIVNSQDCGSGNLG
ncbi:salivary C-type lectin 2-like [Saccoglossus kowalevskii]|uniref:Perlucin-like protein-like n=1 Tax=Saccoglossus kowalevskii TaxID=10224 RepID=A0ABM0LVT5_SACKO|nr:PREDICTED: perlucin-like protein-like [Saccoglossus kowalevskii]